MAVTLERARQAALALPDTTEEPHHAFSSFRVRGRIFVTVPPGEAVLHILLPEESRERALALYPEFLEPLRWGAKVLGVRVTLAKARPGTVLDLIAAAYAAKAGSPARRARAGGALPTPKGSRRSR